MRASKPIWRNLRTVSCTGGSDSLALSQAQPMDSLYGPQALRLFEMPRLLLFLSGDRGEGPRRRADRQAFRPASQVGGEEVFQICPWLQARHAAQEGYDLRQDMPIL